VNVLSKPLESETHVNGNVSNLSQHEVTMSIKYLIDGTKGAMIIGCFSAQQAQKGIGLFIKNVSFTFKQLRMHFILGLTGVEDLQMILPKNNNEQDIVKPCSLWTTTRLKDFVTGM